jgi:LPS-assembly protein
MTRTRLIFTLACWLLARPWLSLAQPVQQEWQIEAMTEQGWAEFDRRTGLLIGTNGVIVKFGGAVLTAERVALNTESGEVVADGKARVQRDEQVWASEHMRYNFKTREIEAAQFRTGTWPIFAGGEGLRGGGSNSFYTATNAMVTSDDIANPAIKIRAKYIKIIPGDKVVAHHTMLYLGEVPVFYFPYFTKNLKAQSSAFTVTPGYRSIFGPYLLGRYNWYLNDEFDGSFHLDYRERRGAGLGPTANYHLGRWGDGEFRYYYLHDDDPNASAPNGALPENRQRVYLAYQANPATNLTIKSLVRYQADTNIVREFFESEYRENPQPNTYLEVNKFWQNFSLNAYAQPRVNDFLETVERLPDVRLTGFRQQLGATPLYYESETSAGYYRRLFAETNSVASGLDYEAARADTYHQLTVPQTFFGWLNFSPRVGGRFTYYSQASGPGGVTEEQSRGVFNTGAELSFKASRLWPEVQNNSLQMDGLRHIVQPSLNYVYVPRPNVLPYQLPQFDTELPSLRLLPLEYPDYNAIDSIDSENVVRLGLGQKLQTKRNGEVVDFANWNVYTDWRIRPRATQSTFSDLYSDLVLRPRSWLSLESLTRYDIDSGLWRMSFHTLTLKPNDAFAWTIGHFYLRDDLSGSPTALGIGNNLFTSALVYRLSENWGLRASHSFEARTGEMQEQAYSLYRDLRSWTAALTFRVRENHTGPQDFTVAFTFSLKAFPRYGLGTDTIRPYSLWGG